MPWKLISNRIRAKTLSGCLTYLKMNKEYVTSRPFSNSFFQQHPDIFDHLLYFQLQRTVIDTSNPPVAVYQQYMFRMQEFGAVFGKAQVFLGKIACSCQFVNVSFIAGE